jgi:anti-sigma factor RsiW
MKTNESSPCNLIRDYAFDELSPHDRRAMEQHLTQCNACVGELDQLRLTTAALRVLPDVEVPRRIAFVSDKVFGWGWLPRFGFAAVSLLALGLSIASWRRPVEVRTVAQNTEVSKAAIDEAVAKAVALAVDKAHAEDVRLTQAALDAVDSKYARQQQNLMLAMQENMDLLQKKSKLVARNLYVDAPMGANQ